jgi:hypothetical protein
VSIRLRSHAAVLLTGGLVALPSIQPDMRTLLRRAGAYVVSYHESLTALVADELYVQSLTSRQSGETVERTIRSQFAIVGGERDEGWFVIRDVIEVDGYPVQERSGIEGLLKVPRTRLRASAFAAAGEQTKYNLGQVYRTINVPTLPLTFLLPENQKRFRFNATRSETTAGASVSVIRYEERDRPTIIRTPSGRSIVSRGTLWIDPPSGQVRKTELVTDEPRGLTTVIGVVYEREARLNLLVPARMTESYETADERITATATYSNFRRFEAEARIVR